MSGVFPRYWTLLFLSFFLSGCMVGPDYVPPDPQVSDGWKETPCDSSLLLLAEDPPEQWWGIFNDPQLNRYIALAVSYNNNLKVAEANVLQARAMRTVAASALFPQISVDYNTARTHFSKNGPLFAPSSAVPQPTPSPVPLTPSMLTAQFPQNQTLFNADIDAQWEIDLFGLNRRNVQVAQANLEASVEQRNDVLISLLAEVARNYIELRSAQKLGELYEENINLLSKTTQITLSRKESGLANQLDVERIQAELAFAKANLPNVQAQIYQAIYALSVLIGQPPEVLEGELLCIKPLPMPPREVALGLRSDLLRRRPDVRRAERQLASATANIGVAVASFYPSVTLVGFDGLQSLKLKDLFKPSSQTWSYGLDVNIPIFQGGRLVGNLALSEAQAQSAYFTYQQAVLKALQEAESDWVAYMQQMATRDQLEEAVLRSARVSQLSNQRYSTGLVNLTVWLDSQRQLISSEQNLLNSQTAALRSLIALYKALGGGWRGEIIAPECMEVGENCE